MLKVLYDVANETVDVSDSHKLEDGLFNDDDDESLATVPFTRNETFASLEMNGQTNPSTITWADLLRKMKTEMSEIEHPQAPSINSTRKFDLNQPFSLVPEGFDKKTGKKRSLLIGCNYRATEGAELKASHDDVRSMKVMHYRWSTFLSFGFKFPFGLSLLLSLFQYLPCFRIMLSMFMASLRRMI
jgi:hypothetical protein